MRVHTFNINKKSSVIILCRYANHPRDVASDDMFAPARYITLLCDQTKRTHIPVHTFDINEKSSQCNNSLKVCESSS
jgi:hypothetical protein